MISDSLPVSTFNDVSDIGIIRDQLDEDWPEAKAFLHRLVTSNSHFTNRDGIEKNVEEIVRMFAPLGFRARRVDSDNPRYAPHLILDNGAAGPCVLGISHLDTVYLPAEQEIGFREFEMPDEMLHGPGTVDNKGGTVMMWLMMKALAAGLLPELQGVRWILGWNASEEELTPDFSAAMIAVAPVSTLACLVFEADNRRFSGHEIVTSRRGLARWRVRVVGRGAHSGVNHADGLNAIVRLAEIVSRIDNLTDYGRGVTVNVGRIEGGVSTNRVPEAATAELEVRFRAREDYDKIKAQLLSYNEAAVLDGPAEARRCEVILEPVTELEAWPLDSGTIRLAEIWEQASMACGLELTSGTRGGLSDANFLGRHFPTMDGLGPRGGNAHAIERSAHGPVITEYVEPESFVPKAFINIMALRILLDPKTSQGAEPFCPR